MTLPRIVTVGTALALAIGTVAVSRDATTGPDRSRASAVAQAVRLPQPPAPALGHEPDASAYVLDDLDRLCGYTYAQFTKLVTPEIIREYSTTLGRTVIVGTPQPNLLLGTSGADLILGFGGDDSIVAEGGDDRVCGGRGDDHISGGGGEDLIRGGPGDDDYLAQPQY